jgi:DNA-binding transcriptional LysR family regulator
VLSIEPGSATGRALRPGLARLARERELRLEPEDTVQSYTAVVQLARAGFGHGLAPISLALALGVPRRVLVRLPAPGLPRPLSLIGRPHTLAREPAASFARELAQVLGQSASGRMTGRMTE